MPTSNNGTSGPPLDAEAIVAPGATDRHAATPPLTVTLLGTGTSTGVPVLGCSCDVCTSDDPRDTRTRCACYVRAGPMGLLIDTGPDFRQQALREDIGRIDAVCYTHHHFDHVVGLDDLRPFFFENKQAMPCYAHPDTAAILRRNYDYIFGADPYPGAANVEVEVVDGPFEVPSRHDDASPLAVDPLLLYHGSTPVYGYRIGRFAYLTDVSRIPEASYEGLQDIDVLVLDALRPRSHPTHFSFEEAVAVARRIGARQTYFVHMTHNVRHQVANDRLPDDIQLAYDGLTVEVPALTASGSTP
jgi:phosphoribosyl 1,2-cyclic phosphate phosphodiesterase